MAGRGVPLEVRAGPAPAAGRRPAPWCVAVALLPICLVLWLPDDPHRFGTDALRVLPMEWPLLALIALCAPGRAWRAVRAALVTVLTLVLLLKLGALAAVASIGRRLDPVLDAELYLAAWNVFSGAVGGWTAAAAVAVAIAALAAATASLAWSLGTLAAAGRGARAGARVSGLLAALLLALAAAAWVATPRPTLVRAESSALLAWHVRSFLADYRDLATYRAALAEDPLEAADPASLLSGLAGRDVLLLFVESYGRSALEDPRYAPVVAARLARFESAIADSGQAARSAWLVSPVAGGQSWLAHVTLLSGLWTSDQRRYRALVGSPRKSLNRLFRDAGWRSVAVMPAITRDWPEGAWYGYDAVHAEAELGYRGEPFNWVTMPDQYTLDALRRLELDPGPRRPVMAEVALISSHAPWTPIPPLLPWEAVGDGRVFTPYARSGDPPEVVWRDLDRVRAQYLDAIDYSLQTIASFVATWVENDGVVVVLGDHQPAPLITGPDASRDVPVHVISRDRGVLDAFAGQGWSVGLRPDAASPRWPMHAFRDCVVALFSEPAAAPRARCPEPGPAAPP